MTNTQMLNQEPVKTDPKKELERQRTNLHNLKFQVQIVEAVIKKLEELAR